MNWGYRIAFLYIGFAVLIFTMIILTYQQRVDLVASDYYEQELKYQERIDAINRTTKLNEPVEWQLGDKTLYIRFPSVMNGRKITGQVLFFCPSNAAQDKTEPIPATTNASATVPVNRLKRGSYKIEISWKNGVDEYYNEGFIQIH